jgi:hypothetical protein
MVYVTKADGSTQEFDKEKIIRTCLKLSIEEDKAKIIADKIENRAYNGISTKKILKMIFDYAKKYRPAIKNRIDLRHAISLLRSKPDFEEFVRIILRENGYEVKPNEIVAGKCAEHEIDGIAKKDNDVIFLEVKHHVEYHSYVGLPIFLEAYAVFEDLVEGGKIGKNSYNFNKLMVVCNTKISDYAKKYAECKNIAYVCWNYPEKFNLNELIENGKLYPITILKDLDSYTKNKLGDNQILTLKQLVDAGIEKLVALGISKNKSIDLIEKAKSLLQD